MVTATSILASYERFEASTAALRERFNAPLPDVEPCSTSCPPVHDECQAMLVVLLQNTWAVFCKELLRLSIEGLGPTLNGTALTPVTLPPEVVSFDSHFRLASNETSREMPGDAKYPVWHNPEYVIRVSTKINPMNHDAIRAGLGGSMEAKNLNVVRNHLIHGTSGKDYEDLLNRMGARGFSVPQFLAYQPDGMIPVFESWIDDLVAAAQNAAG